MSRSSPPRDAQTGLADPARPVRTVGVEEELLLVDADTMRPVPVAGAIMRNPASATGADGGMGPLLAFEVKQEQIEVVSPPRCTLGEVLATIRQGRRDADVAARQVGARAVALATGVVPLTSHLVAAPRYRRIQQEFGITMEEQLTCGLHVHVCVDSDDEGVGILDRIRPWLAVLLALSANSPFQHGVDTGFASYRYQAWSRWPSAGAYDVFGTAAAYLANRDAMLQTGVSLDAGMIYSDARLSDHAPTVETRISDVCLRAEESAALAVLIRALVCTAADEWAAGVPPDPVPAALLRLASWRASKSGLTGVLLDPRTHTPVPAADAVMTLLDHARGHFADEVEERFVADVIATLLAQGTGAARQREVLAGGGSYVDVIAAAVEETTRVVDATATRSSLPGDVRAGDGCDAGHPSEGAPHDHSDTGIR
ncbi:glutamate--cysteine ligase [Microbacterium sp. NPDC089320]|uniref:carboxylate-amine ligase n=1 Tax=Microbacterium sp. NPDC089320 TaxID=3155182 RepID=UPI003440B8E0